MGRHLQPAERVFTMQPANGNDATPPADVPFAKMLVAGTAGTAVINTPSGDSGITVTLAAGIPFYGEVSVVQDGSTATGIVGGYWGG